MAVCVCMWLPTTTTTTVLRLCGICPGQPGWAGTRRNIHTLTLIVVINHPYLLSPSTTIHGILRIQSTCSTVFFRSPSALRSSLTQPCTQAQSCAAFYLGFPNSCLHRHVGVPTGWYPIIVSLLAVLWVFWCKVKITHADAPTTRMEAIPSKLIGDSTSAIPIIFMLDALPGTTLPIYPGLGQAPNMLPSITSGLLFWLSHLKMKMVSLFWKHGVHASTLL